jgi:hypothetical protein
MHYSLLSNRSNYIRVFLRDINLLSISMDTVDKSSFMR